jgi:hypothetical protein
MRQNIVAHRNGTDRRGDRRNHSESSSRGHHHNHAAGRYNDAGNVLIADTFNNRVIETNPRGEIVWQYGLGPTVFPTVPTPPNTIPTVLPAGAIYGPIQVQRIDDLTLIVTGGLPIGTPGLPPAFVTGGIVDTRVILVNEAKQIVFSYGDFGPTPAGGTDLLVNPVSVTFVTASLSNHNSTLMNLINQQRRRNNNNNQNDRSGSSSSSNDHHSRRNHHNNGMLSFDGTLLIVDAGILADPNAYPPVVVGIPPRVIEINSDGQIVWQYPAPGTTLPASIGSINGATRLQNGDTLIFTATPTGTGLPPSVGTILEINQNGQTVRTITALATVGGTNTLSGLISSAYELDNGNLLLTDSGNNRVIEINRQNQIVWAYVTEGDVGSITDSSPRSAVRLANGDTLIADTFNNRVIRVSPTNVIVAQYGLGLGVGGAIPPGAEFNTNSGYGEFTTQLGLFGPSDAKIVGDYTGQLNPLGNYSNSSSSHSRRH